MDARVGTPDAVGTPETILILEPDEMMRRLLVNQLAALGHAALDLAEAGPAHELVRRGNPPVDLVITAIELERLTDGAAFARQIRCAHPGIGVLVIADDIDVQSWAALAVEGIPVLLKPFRLRDLARALRVARAAASAAAPSSLPLRR